jgi:hypothetical protein
MDAFSKNRRDAQAAMPQPQLVDLYRRPKRSRAELSQTIHNGVRHAV